MRIRNVECVFLVLNLLDDDIAVGLHSCDGFSQVYLRQLGEVLQCQIHRSMERSTQIGWTRGDVTQVVVISVLVSPVAAFDLLLSQEQELECSG